MSSAVQTALSNDYERLNSEKYTVILSNSVVLDVYYSTKPHNLKIATLQKGLIFVYKGAERIGEGTGFGVPVLIYPKETYFSSSSTISVAQTAESIKIRKEFYMDRAARNKFRNVYLENQKTRSFIRCLTDLYQKNRRLRFLSLKEFFVNIGVESTFVKTDSAGKVSVTYDIRNCDINVKVDLFHIKKAHLQKIFVLNEQSANFFRKYSDATHSSATDKQIGAWDAVDSKWACLTDLKGRIGFRLWKVNSSVLRRGRESMKNCLDWAGLDYEVDPDRKVFEYKIEILGVNG
jgi:hypothetical protein